MELDERLRLASGSKEELGAVLHDRSQQVLLALVENPALDEEQVLMLLARPDLPQQVIQRLGYREELLRSYAVKLAVVRHAHTPRVLSIQLMRHLHFFDLVKAAKTPALPADLRRVVEDSVAQRAPFLSPGERLSLVRQGTGRVASALLLSKEPQVIDAALQHPRLSEDLVLKALSQEAINAEAVESIAVHPRWSVLYNIKLALLRHPLTSLARVLALAGQVLQRDLEEILEDPRMPANRRAYLARMLARSRVQVRG